MYLLFVRAARPDFGNLPARRNSFDLAWARDITRNGLFGVPDDGGSCQSSNAFAGIMRALTFTVKPADSRDRIRGVRCDGGEAAHPR